MRSASIASACRSAPHSPAARIPGGRDRSLRLPPRRRIAQRQLDFIYGANPFDASTAEGLGRNQPNFYKTTEFTPHTPWISGAVMAGLGSSNDDQPVLLPGWWQTSEYWMESVAHTLLLIRELNRTE